MRVALITFPPRGVVTIFQDDEKLLQDVALAPLTLLRRSRETADIITAPEGLERGACAAQGLPELAAVDSVPRRVE